MIESDIENEKEEICLWGLTWREKCSMIDLKREERGVTIVCKESESESEVARLCPTLCYSMDCSPPSSSVMGFSRQEYWSGLPFPSPGDLSDPGIEPRSPTLQADALTSAPPGNPKTVSAVPSWVPCAFPGNYQPWGWSLRPWDSACCLLVHEALHRPYVTRFSYPL